MSQPIIEVENLSKRYTLGQFNARSLREEAEQFLQRFRRNGNSRAVLPANKSDLWALKDVSFSVQAGEVLGIIGRNGAGKSTLLKILSRITEPTSGQVRIRGRVASLLEVGTGFHPELTGRENIYLNGTILGMTKAEVKAKFDEIVAFAETEKFLDTPVKRYSSGMYVRLAFAVAAHLEPEILVVDEVLAVGDGSFQQKCLGKMGAVAKGGRTVLLVSHNMQAITALCSHAVHLAEGCVAESGEPGTVVSNYLKVATASRTVADDRVWEDPCNAPGHGPIRLRRIRLLAGTDGSKQEIGLDTPISIVIEYWNMVSNHKPLLTVALFSLAGAEVLEDWSAQATDEERCDFPQGLYRTICRIPGSLLNEGTYRVRIEFFDAKSVRLIYSLDEAAIFSVHEIRARRINWHGRFIGHVHPPLKWTTQMIGPSAS